MGVFDHGTATAKRDILFREAGFSWSHFTNLLAPPAVLEQGKICIITAYLPEMEKFAVSLENGAWVTLSMSEKEFKDLFYIELDEKEKDNGGI
ncbi:hypothetical protein LCGC14_1249450 [marine sediment metagenome]|uniref:Uncharacterized protein n=1 Tax=marine sediment metagenome TaxID=412755 RepID=A0A0F9NKS2_9ZZZZ